MAVERGPSVGAVVLHGFTGTTHSVQGVAGALAAAGVAVEAPLLPGHGTTIEDLITARWDDWVAATDAAWFRLAERCAAVVAVGLSMGGTLAADLASRRSGIAGLVAINPYIEPPAPSFLELLRGVLDSGHRCIPAIAGDIAAEGVVEQSYGETPIEPLLSLCEALDGLLPRLPSIACPTLVFTSRTDHVVPPVSSDMLADRVTGPVERVFLERSYHIATLDHDKNEIEARTVEFVTGVAAAGAA